MDSTEERTRWPNTRLVQTERIQKMRDRKISTTAENFLQLKEEGQKSQTGKIKLNPHLETLCGSNIMDPHNIEDKEKILKAAERRVLGGNDNQTDTSFLSGTHGSHNQ